jgi:hypothetical protein
VESATACTGEADIRQRGNQWALRTSRMERVIALEDGRLVLQRFTDRISERELLAKGAVAEEFLAPLADEAELRNGSAGGWRLVGSKQSKLPLYHVNTRRVTKNAESNRQRLRYLTP